MTRLDTVRLTQPEL